MITLNRNGKQRQVQVPAASPLLRVLHDVLGLTATTFGCGIDAATGVRLRRLPIERASLGEQRP